MVKHGAAHQEAQGDLSDLPSCWGCTVSAHSPGRAWPWVQSVAGAWGRAVLVLGGGHCSVSPQIVEARSAPGCFGHLKLTAHTTGTFPQPQQDSSAGKHLAVHSQRGQGSQCLVCMPRAEHRLAMKHAARRTQQCLWERGSPDAQTAEMMVCSFRDLQPMFASRACKSHE